MIRGMCEQFVARVSEPFRLDELWPYAERLERFGIAGFGWGAAWLDPDGALRSHRHTSAFRDDPDRDRLGAIETTSLLVHLRRPSRLSTLGLPDAQPFDDPAGRFAFSHNGDLRDYRAARTRYQGQGRIHGRADSEVGQRWLEDAWSDDEPVAYLLAALHDGFGGEANLAVLTRNGTPHHYAGNPQNPVFTFRLGEIGIASTALYSVDRSLFRYAAKGATDRLLARLHATIALDERGRPVEAGTGRGPRPAGGS
jgi:glutamine phosphoribosylpyrophosphate amidotransferase